jgi:hypothetical protein
MADPLRMLPSDVWQDKLIHYVSSDKVRQTQQRSIVPL